MDQNNRKRPGDHTVKERPSTPAARPKDPRPRTGSTADRAAARRERAAAGGRRTAAERDAHDREPRATRTETRATRTETRSPRTETRSPRNASRETGAPEREARERTRSPEREARDRSRTPEREARDRNRTPEREARERNRARRSREKKRGRLPAPEEEVREEQSPVSRRKKRKPHRVYNTNFGFKFVTMLAVVAVLVLGMIIFFKVKHIQVVLPADESGQVDAYYTEDDIRQASGIHIDDNLLSLSKATIASRIYTALPYVNEIQIKKQLPGTVIITVSEFEVTYGIQDEAGGWWLMSREGRILESVSEQDVRGHLIVTGMPIQVPQPGDWFKPAATDGADMSEIAAKQKVVLEIIPALENQPFVKELVSVDVSTSYDLILWYGSRYEIRLGTTENLSYKLQFLQATLENSDVQHRSGVIDLTFNEDNKVHFLEFR